MQLFYFPSATPDAQHLVFDKTESHHIVKVLRFAQGDTLWLTNGKGWLFHTQITEAHPKACSVQVLGVTCKELPSRHLHLAVAPTKMNERYEWFLEKATEIGVAEITPIICEHSERKVINYERFEKVILSAMKQSLQCYLPKLHQPISLLEFLKNTTAQGKYIAYCQDERQQLHHLLGQYKASSTAILIGPEGDFSPKEIAFALEMGYQPVALGNNRLRTETAAVVACTIAAFEL